MGNPVVYFEIGGRDIQKLRGFYTDLFGWKIQDGKDSGDHLGVDTGGEGGISGGIHGKLPDGVNNWVTFYVQVEDLQEYLSKVEKLGGRTIVPPTPIPGTGSFAIFSDIQGNCIGLYKP